MGGTKILVVQLKQVIKYILMAIAGIIVLGLIVYFLVPKQADQNMDSSALYYPGTYSSEIILHNSPVTVEVVVSENEIVSIKLKNMDESQAAFYPLFQPRMEALSTEIVKTQSLEIPSSNDYAMTQEILIKAIRLALDKAESKATL